MDTKLIIKNQMNIHRKWKNIDLGHREQLGLRLCIVRVQVTF